MIPITSRRMVTALAICVGSLTMGSLTLAAPPAPCSLLTTAEVEQVVGKLKGTPRIEKLGDTAQGIYEFANTTSESDIWLGTADSLAPARKRAKQPVAVNGIDDEALLDRGRVMIDCCVWEGMREMAYSDGRHRSSNFLHRM